VVKNEFHLLPHCGPYKTPGWFFFLGRIFFHEKNQRWKFPKTAQGLTRTVEFDEVGLVAAVQGQAREKR